MEKLYLKKGSDELVIINAEKGVTNFIGRLGENEARVVRFPIREMLNEFPGCTFTLANRRPNDADAYPSPNIAVNGDYLDWTVTSGDLASVGFGECEVIASVDGKVMKSDIYQTVIKTALDDSGTVPEPWEGWVTEVTEAAEQAAAAVEHYPRIENGVWMVWDEENETWTSTGVQAEGQPGRDGQDGAPGAPGADGKDGKDGKDGQDGQDGAPGADGYSPTATVSKSGKIATITITDKNGTTTEQISDGEDGSGADIIDDTAGAGDTDKVWSADKSSGLLSQINVLEPSASDSDVGKVLKAKTVADGKVSEYEFGSLPSVPVTDVQVNGSSILNNGVANVPIASTSAYGVLMAERDEDAKAGLSTARAVTPARQEKSVFYGLAKASGDTSQASSENAVGTYTETAKSSIAQMLDAPETVSGSTPSITAKAGVRYICGECSTLTITVPTRGCIDVVFESGSTATVLTVTPTKTGVTAVKWANGFDPTSLEANTMYELNILDGEYGVSCSWT